MSSASQRNTSQASQSSSETAVLFDENGTRTTLTWEAFSVGGQYSETSLASLDGGSSAGQALHLSADDFSTSAFQRKPTGESSLWLRYSSRDGFDITKSESVAHLRSA